ncbi:MAG: hypothetical protein ACP5RE_00540 [Candidatus Acidifodinimicrobium sp.]
MNFDLFYGIVTFIFNIITAAAIFLLLRSYRNKNTLAQVTRMFLDAKRFTLAFISLLATALSLAIGYSISIFLALSNPQTTFWEYTNLFVFFFVMLFFVLFSGIYSSWRVKRKMSKPTNIETPTNDKNTEQLASNSSSNEQQVSENTAENQSK